MTSYTRAQQEAIDCLNETLQIIACAGSGKTQVISQRIAAILAQPDVEPRNVIAFTFTEKAAAELKDRILGVVAEKHDQVIGLAEMYVGTMHGYCLDLLQRLVPETFKFSVLTDITARLLVDRNSRKSGLTTCPTSSPKVPTLRRYLHSKLFLQAVSVLREDTVDEAQVDPRVYDSLDSYLTVLVTTAAFDFTEMINLAVTYLEIDPEEDDDALVIQNHIRDDIKYVVVDEYQDVNSLQERLISGLAQFGANLCVVGDDDQTIYQWRGSQVSNIVTFGGRHDGVRQVSLTENFRSSKGVVELARSVAERIPDSQRLTKRMVSADNQQWERGDLLALTFDDPAAEAAWICDRIEELRGIPFQDTPAAPPRGLSWSDCAVLYRSVAADADPLVAELRRRGIPYLVKGLNRLFDSVEIRAVVGIFRAMVGDPSDSDLRALWSDADLLPEPERWPGAIAVLEKGRDFDRGARWGVYMISVRLCAAEQVATDADRENALDRLLRCYVATAQAASQYLDPRAPILERRNPFRIRQDALDWLDVEHPNLIAAVTLAYDTGRYGHTVELVNAMYEFFWLRLHVNDWIASYQVALAAARNVHDRCAEARVLHRLGFAFWRISRCETAADHHREALTIFRALGDRLGEADALRGMGAAERGMNRPQVAERLYQHALELYRALGDRRGEAKAIYGVGLSYAAMKVNSRDRVAVHYHQAQQIFCEVGDRDGEAGVWANLGRLYVDIRDWDAAIKFHRQALQIRQELDDRHGLADQVYNLAVAYQEAGRWQDATDHYERAAELYRECGDGHGEAWSLHSLGTM